ncbi:MAG: hypothetical protein AB1489_24355, partial [Acidobacteriota bacterium]
GLFERMTKEKFNRIVEAVSNLSTLDQLVLNGTQILNGDLIHIQVGNNLYQRHEMESSSQVQISWIRNKVIGLAKAILNVGVLGTIKLPGEKPVRLTPQDHVLFHTVGQQEPGTIPLTYINQINIG